MVLASGMSFLFSVSVGCLKWPQEYVRPFAHCEYGEGYMVFDRIGISKEVWRRACDVENAALPTESIPDDLQMYAAAVAAAAHRSSAPRGHFKPWALIQMPDFGRAFRFVYPTLLVAAEDQAFLWDIPTARHIATISDIQTRIGNSSLGRITYVEVNDRYVVICGTRQLRIFNRPQGALVYHITAKNSKFTNWTLNVTGCKTFNPSDCYNKVLLPVEISTRSDNVNPFSDIAMRAFENDSFVAGVF